MGSMDPKSNSLIYSYSEVFWPACELFKQRTVELHFVCFRRCNSECIPLSFEYNTYIQNELCLFSTGNVRAKPEAECSTFPSQSPWSCHSAMQELCQKLLLISWPWNADVCVWTRRISLDTRLLMCICLTCVPPCVILLLTQCEGAESALCWPHNAQTFFQLAGKVCLHGAWIYCKSDPDKNSHCVPLQGDRLKEEEGKSCQKLCSILLDGLRASHAAGQCLALLLSACTSVSQS